MSQAWLPGGTARESLHRDQPRSPTMKTVTNLLPKLTPTQPLLLRSPATPPETLRGGARATPLTGRRHRGCIEPAGDGHALTDAGFAAVGRQRPVPLDAVQKLDTTGDLQLLECIPVRPGTKLAALVVALRRPQGATNLQLTLATAWQPPPVPPPTPPPPPPPP